MLKRTIWGAILVLAGLLLLAACAGGEEEATPTVTKAPATAAATAAATGTKAPATAAATTAATATKAAAGDAAKGKPLFDTNCNACHPSGSKGVGPSLVGTKLGDADMSKIVKEGKGSMPGFAKLTADDIANLTAYIRTLK